MVLYQVLFFQMKVTGSKITLRKAAWVKSVNIHREVFKNLLFQKLLAEMLEIRHVEFPGVTL